MSLRNSLSIFILALIFLGACSKDNNPAQTNLRFVHMSPDAPSLDYSINNSLFIGSNSYTAPTPYRPANAGSVTVSVSATGTATSLFNINGNFQTDKYYSVFLFDSVGKLKITGMEDDRTAPPTGKCHLRFLHLGTDQGPVDIIRAGGPIKLFSNRSFNDHSTTASLTGYTAIDPGPFSVTAIVAGSVNTFVTQLPSFAATAGKSYTLVLRGFKNAVALSPQSILLGVIEDK